MTLDTKEQTVQNLINGFKVMVLMRGLPGSGKSTLAKKIVAEVQLEHPSMYIFSTDDYFKRNGRYNYDFSLLSAAHEWNQKRVRDAVASGLSPIIVDNTNLEVWEMKAYAVAGVAKGYILEVLHSDTPWATKPGVLANRNTHNVPIQKIKYMLDKYQYRESLNGKDLLHMLGIGYCAPAIPPCYRLLPPIDWSGKRNDKKEHEVPNVRVNTSQPGPSTIDLIDFSDYQSNPNKKSDVKENETSNDSNDSWQDIWDKPKNQIDKPKPQRNGRDKKLSELLMDDNAINWTPINNTLESWNVDNTMLVPKASTSVVIKDTSENSTMTENINNISSNTSDLFYRVLTGNNRDINQSNQVINHNKIPSKPTLDSSVMVTPEDIEKSQADRDAKIQMLFDYSLMFKHIPKSILNDILNQCGGDVNWAADILMDSMPLNVPMNQTDENEDVIDLTYPDDLLNGWQVVNNTKKENTPKVNTNPNTKNNLNKFKDKTAVSENAVNLKKHLESNFDFNDNLYSEHCLKLKKRMHGESSKSGAEPVPSTSQRSISESSDDNEEEEATIEFRLGHECIGQLDKLYTTSYVDSCEKFEPVINMPISLANQLYALWQESICNQRKVAEMIVKEDEELAMQLQTIECKKDSYIITNDTTTIQEILDMELALAIYHSDLSSLNYKQPQNLAEILTRQKLSEMFPDIDENILSEIYAAHDNNFERTFEVLLTSTGRLTQEMVSTNDQNTIKQILAQQERSLLERAKKEKELAITVISSDSECEDDNKSISPLTEDEIKNSIHMFRNEAQYHLKIRNENFNKAKIYINRNMPHVAMYYSNLAALHTNKYEKANASAVSRVFQLNSLNDDKCTVNLHELHLKEALHIIDIFLDKHIARLRENNLKKETLFIITGRGKHSPRNKPVIKPATKKRLIQRGLRCDSVNPGVFCTQVTPNNYLSNEMQVGFFI